MKSEKVVQHFLQNKHKLKNSKKFLDKYANHFYIFATTLSQQDNKIYTQKIHNCDRRT